MSTFTTAQLDAIAQAKRERFPNMKAADIAVRLELEEHPAWKGGAASAPTTSAPAAAPAGDLPEIDPGPPPGATQAAPTTPAPAPARVELPAVRAEALPAAPAPARRHLPAAPVEVPEGAEELDASDLVLPTLTLKQAQTKDIPDEIKIPDGHWFFRQTPALHSEKRRIVILHVGKGRSFMLPYQKTLRPPVVQRIREVSGVEVREDREKPVCFSRDRVSPVKQEDLNTLAAACKDCTFARWRTVAGKPVMDCGESYELLVVDRTGGAPGMPCWLYLRSSAIAPVKNALTALKWQAHTQKIDGHVAPLFAFELELGSVATKTDDGNFYKPTFGAPVPIAERELIAFYRGIRESALATQERSEVIE